MSDAFTNLARRISELERRNAGQVRLASVTKNHGDGTLDLEDGTDFKPTEIPQGSISAGAWKLDAPAEPGAQGILFSPGGETEQAIFLPLLPSDATPHASTKVGTAKLEGPGGETLTMEGGNFTFEHPSGFSVSCNQVDIQAPTIKITGSSTHKGNILVEGNVKITGNLDVVGGLSYGGGGQGQGEFKHQGGFEVEGNAMTHNGKNVGFDHQHKGVKSGGSNTGVPA